MHRAFFVLLLFIFLTGCSPIVRQEQLAVKGAINLQNGESFGQTFVARYDGLRAVDIFLKPDGKASGTLDYQLSADPDAVPSLAVGNLSLATLPDAGGYLRFEFTPQRDSHKHYYAFRATLKDAETLLVHTAPGDAYINGAAYQNGEPLDAQLAFQLVYDPVWLLWGLLKEGVGWLMVLGVAGFLFVIPGWVLLSVLWPGWSNQDWAGKLGMSSGMGILLYPLLLEWTDVLGLHLGVGYSWLPPLVGLVYLFRKPRIPSVSIAKWRETWARFIFSVLDFHTIILLLILALIVFTRFWAIRNLDAPLWGDSFQHTLMAKLLVDHGGLFDSWQPYTELATFTYHFGFHTSAALISWLSRLPIEQAVLWAGQIMNVLAVLALYPLANKVGGGRWAGTGALLVAGLLTSMPMFYVNWGRYTQLTGQVILPLTVLLVWEMYETGKGNWRLNLLRGMVFAGLALTHYRVAAFAALFFPAACILLRKNTLRAVLTNVVAAGALAGLLFLPWFINVFGGKILEAFGIMMTLPASAIPQSLEQYNTIGDLTVYLPKIIWIFLALCTGWGLLRRSRGVVLLGIWWFLVLLAANPGWIGLPGVGVLNNFSVFIALYIPAGAIIGAAIGWLVDGWSNAQSSRFFKQGLSFLFLLVLAGTVLNGARARAREVDFAHHAMFTRPDMRAAAWIEKNTPSNARFLINSFFAYGGTSVVGADGGWWLPVFTRRMVTVPPLTYVAEQGPRPDYIDWVNALTAEIDAKGATNSDILKMLDEREVGYVYIGQQQGRVNWNGPVLDPQVLLEDPAFRLVYHQDRVWIFERAP